MHTVMHGAYILRICQNHTYIRCIYDILGRVPSIQVNYGANIRLWPTVHMCGRPHSRNL